jgi:multiple sugar transport system substrate-binding protein
VAAALLAAIPAPAGASGSRGAAASGRVELTYWEKWTRFEGDAMKAVVDAFNRAQDRITVRYLTVSNIPQKTLIATAGGDPPDLAGLYGSNVVPYADKHALTPLDEILAAAGVGPNHFISTFWNGCRYRGRTWAVPTTPASVALHWNKAMFRAAGLDPDRPPRTIAELDAMADRLTRRDRNGKIVQLGFLPWEPGWWNWAWGYFFGGRLWDGEATITCAEPPNVEAYRWVQSYSRRYGISHLQVFTSGFGNFASPQNAFMAGKVAMELQGVWMYNFITQYAPAMEWGAAPFPTAKPELYGRSIADMDVLVIPRDAPHPVEAAEFLVFVISRGPMEELCMGQRKFSPLAEVTDQFWRVHPHPQIRLFSDLARHPLTFMLPQLTFWDEYATELQYAFERVYLNPDPGRPGYVDPADALEAVRVKMQKRLDRELRRLKRLGLPVS